MEAPPFNRPGAASATGAAGATAGGAGANLLPSRGLAHWGQTQITSNAFGLPEALPPAAERTEAWRNDRLTQANQWLNNKMEERRIAYEQGRRTNDIDTDINRLRGSAGKARAQASSRSHR